MVVLDPAAAEQDLARATADYQAAARLGLEDARRARPAVQVAAARRRLVQSLAADASAAPVQFTQEKRDGKRTTGEYRPVVVEEVPGGFVKTYYGTYTRRVTKRGYEKAVTPTKVERYDERGVLVEREVYRDYDRNDEGEEEPYLYSREKFAGGGLVSEFRQDYDNRTGELQSTFEKNYLTGKVRRRDYRDPRPSKAQGEVHYTVADAQGHLWRSKDPDFIKGKTGVDPRLVNEGTTVLRDQGTGKVYYARNLGGMLVGVGEAAPASASPVSVSLTSQAAGGPSRSPGGVGQPLMPDALLEAQISMAVKGRPKVVLGPEVAAEQEARLRLRDPLSAVPPGVGSPSFQNVPSFQGEVPHYLQVKEKPAAFAQVGPVPLSIEGGPEMVARGEDKLLRAGLARDSGEGGEALKLAGAGVAYKFAGGVRNAFKSAVEDPVGTVAVAGAYALGGALAGSAGVGVVFAGQNALEVATGQEPSAVRIVRDPITSAGEIAPFAALGVVAEGTVAGVRSARLRLASEDLTRRYGGELVTRDTQRSLAQPPGTALSTEIQARPLLYEWQQAMSQDRAGARITVGSRQRVLGDPVFLTGEELARQPTDFLFKADIEHAAQVRPESGEPGGQFGLSAASQEGAVRYSVRGLTSAEKLARTSEPVIRIDVREGVAPGVVREAVGIARVEFTPIDLSKVRDLAVRPQGGGAHRPGARLRLEQGNLLEYRPGLDYWEPLIEAEGPGGRFSVMESFATGEQRVSGSPLVIEKVTLKETGKAPGLAMQPSKDKGGVSIHETDVDAPGSGGSVLKQRVKLVDITEPEQKAEAQAVTVKEPQALAELEAAREKVKVRPVEKPRLKVVEVQTLKEAALTGGRFKAGQKPRLRVGVVTLSGVATGQGVGQSQGRRQGSDQSQRQGQGEGQGQKVSTKQSAFTSTGQSVGISSLTRAMPRLDVPVLRKPSAPPLPDEPTVPKLRVAPLKEGGRERGGFTVFIKEQGQFRELAAGFEDKQEAFARAKAVLRGSSKASAQVRDAEGRPVAPVGLGREFRLSKKDKSVLVERNAYRIDTAGERLEITSKGLASSRRKRGGLLGKFAF